MTSSYSPYPRVVVYSDVLDKDTCDSIIRRFDDDDNKYEGGIGCRGDVDRRVKRTIEITLDNNDWIDIDSLVYTKIQVCFRDYMSLMNNKYLLQLPDHFAIIDTGYQIQKYCKGGFYKEHHDFHVNFDKQTARIVTFILYLNTIKSKGRTIFHEPVNTAIQPCVGSVLFFPATWDFLHSGESVDDYKYIITGWFQIQPRDEVTM